MGQLTAPERTAAIAIQQAMNVHERNRLRAELVALPIIKAVARVRQILAQRQQQKGKGDAQKAHLIAVLSNLNDSEKVAIGEFLDALPPKESALWSTQIFSRSPESAAELMRAHLQTLAEVQQEQAFESDHEQLDEPEPNGNSQAERA